MTITEGNVVNAWRFESPGSDGWHQSPRLGDPDRTKYFMVNVDSHATEPKDMFTERMPERFHSRLPRMVLDDGGNVYLHIEGLRPRLVKKAEPAAPPPDQADLAALMNAGSWSDRLEPDDVERTEAGSTAFPDSDDLARRRAFMERDGVDVEIVVPSVSSKSWATPDPEMSVLMCQARNRWALDTYGPDREHFAPVALLPVLDIDEAVKEAHWAADNGFRLVALPCKPVHGPKVEGEPHYNQRQYDPLWAAVAETGMPVSFHAASGMDPRMAGGDGAAMLNLVNNSMMQVIDPVTYMIAGGVMHRHPTLKVGALEGGIGWLPWMLQSLDEAFFKHHMWLRPVTPEPPSFYFRRQCFASFVEDEIGLQMVEELDLTKNVMWSNDFPHQEGSWPHSAEAIERQMQHLSEEARADILGLNAARALNLEVPADRRP